MDGRGTVNDGGEALHIPNVAEGGSRETDDGIEDTEKLTMVERILKLTMVEEHKVMLLPWL